MPEVYAKAGSPPTAAALADDDGRIPGGRLRPDRRIENKLSGRLFFVVLARAPRSVTCFSCSDTRLSRCFTAIRALSKAGARRITPAGGFFLTLRGFAIRCRGALT